SLGRLGQIESVLRQRVEHLKQESTEAVGWIKQAGDAVSDQTDKLSDLSTVGRRAKEETAQIASALAQTSGSLNQMLKEMRDQLENVLSRSSKAQNQIDQKGELIDQRVNKIEQATVNAIRLMEDAHGK